MYNELILNVYTLCFNYVKELKIVHPFFWEVYSAIRTIRPLSPKKKKIEQLGS